MAISTSMVVEHGLWFLGAEAAVIPHDGPDVTGTGSVAVGDQGLAVLFDGDRIRVDLTVEVFRAGAPAWPPQPGWGEVVEVSIPGFREKHGIFFATTVWGVPEVLDRLRIDWSDAYRVRIAERVVDRAPTEDDDRTDRLQYRVQIWPQAAPSPARLLR